MAFIRLSTFLYSSRLNSTHPFSSHSLKSLIQIASSSYSRFPMWCCCRSNYHASTSNPIYHPFIHSTRTNYATLLSFCLRTKRHKLFLEIFNKTLMETDCIENGTTLKTKTDRTTKIGTANKSGKQEKNLNMNTHNSKTSKNLATIMLTYDIRKTLKFSTNNKNYKWAITILNFSITHMHMHYIWLWCWRLQEVSYNRRYYPFYTEDQPSQVHYKPYR